MLRRRIKRFSVCATYLLTACAFGSATAHAEPVLSHPASNTKALIEELEALASRAPLIPPIPEPLEERLKQYLQESTLEEDFFPSRPRGAPPPKRNAPSTYRYSLRSFHNIAELSAKLRIQSVTPELVAHITLPGAISGTVTSTMRARVAEALVHYGGKPETLILERLGWATQRDERYTHRFAWTAATYFKRLYRDYAVQRLRMLASRSGDDRTRDGILNHVIPAIKAFEWDSEGRRRRILDTSRAWYVPKETANRPPPLNPPTPETP